MLFLPKCTHGPLPGSHLTLQPSSRSLFHKKRTMRNIPLSLSIPYKTVAMAKKSIWCSDVPGSRYKALRERRQTAKHSIISSPFSLEAPEKSEKRNKIISQAGMCRSKKLPGFYSGFFFLHCL